MGLSDRMLRLVALVLAVGLTLAVAVLVRDLRGRQWQAQALNGAINLTGVLDGAPYEIRVPENWNGTLVMYAHGLRNVGTKPQDPSVPRPASAFIGDHAEEAMLRRGYAIAGSAFRTDGWAVQDGLVDLVRLRRHFDSVASAPQYTLLAGLSMGSVIALEAAEQSASPYDGFLATCPIGAGTPRMFDQHLAVALAYDAVFGWPSSWGTPADIREDLDYEAEVLPVLRQQLDAPGGRAKFELIRLLAGLPSEPDWPFRVWSIGVKGRAELERRAGGSVVQNLDHRYGLSAADREYLSGLGASAKLIDGVIERMQQRVTPGPGRKYVKRFAEFSGKIDRPVLTLANQVDAVVPVEHVSAYRDSVRRPELLSHAWTGSTGHCQFTITQHVVAVDALHNWVRSGRRPGPLPASLGFVDFQPPPWPLGR